jgi:hypothetical protein
MGVSHLTLHPDGRCAMRQVVLVFDAGEKSGRWELKGEQLVLNWDGSKTERIEILSVDQTTMKMKVTSPAGNVTYATAKRVTS